MHLECGTSDHKLIVIFPSGIPKKLQRPWRFEQMWIDEEGYQDSVELAWRQPIRGNLMEQVEGKLKRCQLNLTWWSRNSFGNVIKQLKEKKEKLRREEEAAIKGGTVEGVLKLKREISDLLVKEEKMWKRRSRALWLHEGDKNTRYFHSRATHRYRRNKICELRNLMGQMCMDEEEIAQILISYYQDLFTSASPCNLDQAVEDIPCTVTTEMNNMLQEVYTREEVDRAVFQMEALKAPRPNGMHPLFFQHYWKIIGDEVSAMVLNCLNSGSFPQSLNNTFITLIPKVKSPSLVSEFCPISLCNTLYKIVSKVVANRLKKNFT